MTQFVLIPRWATLIQQIPSPNSRRNQIVFPTPVDVPKLAAINFHDKAESVTPLRLQMDRGVIESDATGTQTGVTALTVDVLVRYVHERNVTTELTLQRVVQIHRLDLQNRRRLDSDGPVQQNVVRSPEAPLVVMTLGEHQRSQAEQQDGQREGLHYDDSTMVIH